MRCPSEGTPSGWGRRRIALAWDRREIAPEAIQVHAEQIVRDHAGRLRHFEGAGGVDLNYTPSLS
jgi:hypothetical protein